MKTHRETRDRFFLARIATTMLLVASVNPMIAAAQTIKINSPSAYANREGPGITDADCCLEFLRYQQVIDSDDFVSLPGGRGFVTGVALRPDATQTGRRMVGENHFVVRLSTTSISAGGLNQFFNDNAGLDEQLVLDDVIAVEIAPVGPAGGPMEIDYVIGFQQPFFYDSRKGNLLIDNTFQDGLWPDMRFDWYPGPSASIFTEDPDADTGNRNDGGGGVHQFTFAAPGDVDADGDLDSADIDAISKAVRETATQPWFDVNYDDLVTADDRITWVQDLRQTWFGDSDLDGEFNSSDLVAVFAAGEYEDGVPMNSTWSTGDFDGNGDFGSGDLVAAFSDGGYERGPRAAVNAVPEPASFVMLIGGLVGIATSRRRAGWEPAGRPV